MKKYIFEPWTEEYIDLFSKEHSRIQKNVPYIFKIEHVGSTSVKDLGGKGIIDIAILGSKEHFQEISAQLEHLGYEFRPSFSTHDRLYFVGFFENSKRELKRFHIHLTHENSDIWKELIGFRDFLRQNQEACSEYSKIKELAVKDGLEGEKYRERKNMIIQKILKNLPNK